MKIYKANTSDDVDDEEEEEKQLLLVMLNDREIRFFCQINSQI
jgi:hypothetical protein